MAVLILSVHAFNRVLTLFYGLRELVVLLYIIFCWLREPDGRPNVFEENYSYAGKP